ncbi:MAG: ribosome maturation factor RimP [Elusimicrobia bacterium]|nr:ribosome maturation factor RimP [Elusimicrobiota bacterium]
MEEKILEIIKDDIGKEGLEIVEIRCSKFKGRTNIRVFIDKTGGVTVADCEKASGIIGFLLDGSNLNFAGYELEVSSPGLDRPLAKEADFNKHLGETVMIFLRENFNDKNYFEGKINGSNDGFVEITAKDKNIKIPIDRISKAKLKIEI